MKMLIPPIFNETHCAVHPFAIFVFFVDNKYATSVT